MEELKTTKKEKKKLGAKKTTIIIVSVFLAVVLLLTGAFFALRYMGFRGFHKNDKHIDNENVKVEDEDYITYKNQKYKLNSDIITVLIIGIDKDYIGENYGIGRNGQADVLFLAAIDTKKKSYTVIPISREAMVDVAVYTEDGMYTGVEREQICLAYAYGATPEECSENVLKAVKRMFYGLNINSYVTIDIEGLSKFTKMVGGVKLTCLETLGKDRVYFREGDELNLKGEAAVEYIRLRGSDIEANNRRMQRQKQFLTALISKAGNAVMEDFTKLTEYYNSMKPYTSTNIDLAKLTYFASTCLTRDMGSNIAYKSIEGTMTESKYSEFNINEEQLLDLIIDTFYIKMESNKKTK